RIAAYCGLPSGLSWQPSRPTTGLPGSATQAPLRPTSTGQSSMVSPIGSCTVAKPRNDPLTSGLKLISRGCGLSMAPFIAHLAVALTNVVQLATQPQSGVVGLV